MTRRIVSSVLFAALAAFLVVSVPALADLKPSVQGDQKSNSKPRKPAIRDGAKKPAQKKFSASRERGVLKFVELHHPELSGLLNGLKAANDKQYRAAIQDVLRDKDRLAKIAERDSERHAVSLDLWKLNSRLRLEVARFSMSGSSGNVDKLVELMKNRNNARVRLHSLDRNRLVQRLEKLDLQIEKLSEKTEDGFLKEVDRLRKSVAARARKSKTDRARAKDTSKQKTTK